MRNPTVYYVAIGFGIIILIGGVFYEANIILGHHPTRGYAAIAIGAILVIGGIIGAFATRPHS